MICPNCSSEVQDTNYKCPNCRTILKQDMDPAQFRPEPQPQKTKRSGSNAAGILVVIIALAAVGALLYFGVLQEKEARGEKPAPAGAVNAAVSTGTTAGEITEIAPVINSDDPGQEIDIEDYVQKGKITIFDFYSDYCPPCRRVAPLLKSLDNKRPDIKVLKIDVNRPGKRGIDWGSPVLSQYGIRGIPYFVVYDESGEQIASGRDATREVQRLLQEAGIAL